MLQLVPPQKKKKKKKKSKIHATKLQSLFQRILIAKFAFFLKELTYLECRQGVFSVSWRGFQSLRVNAIPLNHKGLSFIRYHLSLLVSLSVASMARMERRDGFYSAVKAPPTLPSASDAEADGPFLHVDSTKRVPDAGRAKAADTQTL